MSLAVLISIRPEWCNLIASGEKTIEIRKTKPKLATPFKCYIYCTGRDIHRGLVVGRGTGKQVICCNYKTAIPAGGVIGNGKVIGEFVCDRIIEDVAVGYRKGYYEFDGKMGEIFHDSLLFPKDMRDYLGDKKGYGWHISDLKIYDKPKELSEFHKPGCSSPEDLDEGLCKYCYETDYGEKKCYSTPYGPVMCEGDYCDSAYDAYLEDEGFTLTRPPQSWCYVEELK